MTETGKATVRRAGQDSNIGQPFGTFTYMAFSGAVTGAKSVSTRSRLDRFLFALSVYLVPMTIALGAFLSLFLPFRFQSSGPTQVVFSAFSDERGQMRAADALQRLASAPPATRASLSTKLSEAPFWFVFSIPADKQAHTIVEVPSRHAQTLACWQISDLKPFGRADRTNAYAPMYATKAGFALDLGALSKPETFLCRGTFSGPAQLTVLDWDAPDLRMSELDYRDSASLITGGLLTLAVFVFVTALINREWTYFIFSAWLVGNLRLCANAMGWDTEWLAHSIPAADLPLLRKVTFATYYILTGALFSQLFRRELRRVGYRWLLRCGQYAGLVLLSLAFVLPYQRFVPALWLLGGFGISALIFLLACLVRKARSRTLLWYVASLAVVLISTFCEVIGAAFGLPALAAGISPVLGALSSSMMAAFAIAERMRSERWYRQKAQFALRSTYRVVPVGLFTLDASGYFVHVNPAMRAMLGMPEYDQNIGHWIDYFQEGAWGSLHALLMSGREAEIEVRGAPQRGTADRRYLLKAISSDHRIEGSLQDVTERSKATEQLRFLSEHDPLTGSLNRRGIENAIASQSGNASSWALAYLDLDRFKLINDLFGHHSGDEVLRQVCTKAKAVLGEQSQFGRMGGDEFVFVMGDIAMEDAIAKCRALLSALNDAPYQLDRRSFQVKASIGLVACLPGMGVEDALSHADRACREAKTSPSNRLVVYDDRAASYEQRAAQLRLVESFRLNRLPPGLFLMAQPIMSLTAPTESLNFEILLRMRRPDGTVVSPDQIIAAAEEAGNVAALDTWVVESILEWIEAHQNSLVNTRFICVNLSGGSLNDERFAEGIFEIFARHRSVLHYLCLEITESVALHDLANTQRFLARLHEMGVRTALDDFGAGYTSFRYLKSLGADALKIDGQYVRAMCTNPADFAIVEALVGLARNLGMRSVAEWVEDLDTLRMLHEIGVDYVQGYVIARPQECSAILDAKSSASFVTDSAVAHFIRELTGSAERLAY
jgi:diguanylate cyclase (GGDEF)-like protein